MSTEMQIINVVPGSQEWHAHRHDSNNASDVPAAKGVSPYTSRSELLRRRATGIVPDVDKATQRRFDAGHAAEAAARPIAERIIGEELFPATGVRVVDGVRLSASFDGLTMMCDKIFECKLWNEEKAAFVRDGIVPPQDHGQVVQQLVISKADACLYMVSDGTEERTVHTWVTLQDGDEKDLVSMWRQFEQDLVDYQHVETKPVAIGRAPESLPALRIEVTGMVTASNLAEFKEHALAVFAGINTDLQTDEDFASAEKAVKFCKDAEERLDAAKSHALSQTASIDELFRTIDQIKDEAKAVRLKLDKLVKAEKDSRKVEIVTQARQEIESHIMHLNQRIGGTWMPVVSAATFADAIKGLKSIDSMREKVGNALRNLMFEASQTADRIEANWKCIDDAWLFLFPDFGQLCTKEPEDFARLYGERIQNENERAAAKLEAERARIRAEEQAKAEADAQAKARAEQAERDAETARLRVIEEARIAQEQAQAIADALAANRAEEEEAAKLKTTQTVYEAGPVPDESPVAANEPVITPEEKRAAVVEHQDEIAQFMASRDWGKDAGKVRAVLVEYVKFTADLIKRSSGPKTGG